MKINGNEIRRGNLIEHKGRLCVAVKTEHVKPGKGPAYAQIELKDVRDGTKMNERFRASESVERVRLDEASYQFLFEDGHDFTFMNQETFDQISISSDFLGHSAAFLQEGMIISVTSYEEEIVGVVLPDTIVMKIAEAEPVVKGQTAASSYKPAVLENGVRVMVPPHIGAGVKIVVNTNDSTYVERAKD